MPLNELNEIVLRGRVAGVDDDDGWRCDLRFCNHHCGTELLRPQGAPFHMELLHDLHVFGLILNTYDINPLRKMRAAVCKFNSVIDLFVFIIKQQLFD